MIGYTIRRYTIHSQNISLLLLVHCYVSDCDWFINANVPSDWFTNETILHN